MRKHNKEKMPTAKKIMVFLFINCSLIELFTGYVTIRSLSISLMTGIPPDFSPLNGLIGTVVAEVVGYAVYAAKAALENRVGGITYESAKAKWEYEQQNKPLVSINIDNEPKG